MAGQPKENRIQKVDTAAASPKGSDTKGPQLSRRRRFPSASPTAEGDFEKFERLVERTRSMKLQLDEATEGPKTEFIGSEEDDGMGMSFMGMDFMDDAMAYMGRVNISFPVPGEEDKEVAADMSIVDAEAMLHRMEGWTRQMYERFTAPGYPYPRITKAARRLYEPKPNRRVMTEKQRARYADQNDVLANGYGDGPWDVDLDPTRPAPEEKK